MINIEEFFKEETEGGKFPQISKISQEIYELYNQFEEKKEDFEKNRNIHSLTLADSISGKIIDLLNIRLRKLQEIKNKSKDPAEKEQIENSIIWTANFIKHVRGLRKQLNLDI